ncbi:alpha/beta-hydrolase [Thozetella sp. PMI_491]|nr:alpha/beta-hydrolase [Thozetella sp. PMI_491]
MSDVVLSLGPHGRIRGRRGSNGVCRFLGIPYAQPPTGERRWKKPEALADGFSYESDGAPRDCTEFGNICPQETYILYDKPFNEIPGAKYSEDCLNVNIWTPAEKPPAGTTWPVLTFIHGGWLQIGSPSVEDGYQPLELLSGDGVGLQAIVVSIGYRLNVFGFLAGEGVEGNFGFWDQRLALEWIQEHAAFFGGDPSKVTLMGHSAGGFSAHTQLQYELLHTDGSKPLFKNVFLYSNAIPAQPKTRGEANGQLLDLCKVLGLEETSSGKERLQTLRKISEQTLVDALPKLKMSNFRAVTDGALIHADMVKKFEDHTFAKLFKDRGYRLMTGETETEQYLYSKWLPPKNEEELPTKLQNYYSAEVAKKLLAHPGYKGDVVDVFGRIVSDMQVRAPIRILCRQLVEGGVPAERILRYRIAFRPGFLDENYPPEAGVTHGADLPYWWAVRQFGFTDEEWSALKAWLSRTLAKLVDGSPFEPAALQQYLLFGPDGKSAVVEDQYWEHLMSVIDAVSN